jgi:hypothetical protein
MSLSLPECRALVRKIKAAARSPFILCRIVLDKATGQTIQIGKFHLLEFKGLPNIPETRGSGMVRRGLVSDIEEMARLDTYQKQNIFRDRFSLGDDCVVADVNGKIVGYEWFSCRPCHREQRYQYRIPIPEDAWYAYDAFIKREYRLRGIWLKFKKYLGELMKESGRRRIITLIDADNTPSLNTHRRFGFILSKSVFFVKFGNKRYFRETRTFSAGPAISAHRKSAPEKCLHCGVPGKQE